MGTDSDNFINMTERLSRDDILGCLYYGEVGDGILYAKLFKNKFIFDVTTKKWLWFNGCHWEPDIFERHLSAVDIVAKTYEALLYESRPKNGTDEMSMIEKHSISEEYFRLEKFVSCKIRRLRTVAGRKSVMRAARFNGLAMRGSEYKEISLRSKRMDVNDIDNNINTDNDFIDDEIQILNIIKKQNMGLNRILSEMREEIEKIKTDKQ